MAALGHRPGPSIPRLRVGFLYQNSLLFLKTSRLPLAGVQKNMTMLITAPPAEQGGVTIAEKAFPATWGYVALQSPACSDDCDEFYRCKKKLYLKTLFIFLFNMLNISCFKRDEPFQLSLSFLRTTRNSCKTMLSHGFFAKV